MRILDADTAVLHAANPPGRIAQENNVAGQALHRKIFIDGPDLQTFRLRDHGIIGRLGDRAAGG